MVAMVGSERSVVGSAGSDSRVRMIVAGLRPGTIDPVDLATI